MAKISSETSNFYAICLSATPYNSPFQRKRVEAKSAFLPPMHQMPWLRVIHDGHMFLLISQPLDQSDEPEAEIHSSSQIRHSSFYFPSSTVRGHGLSGSSVTGFFPGIHHLLTAVVLTKCNILHIFPIRSGKRFWSVCIFLKVFSFNSFYFLLLTSTYWFWGSVFWVSCGWVVADLRPRTVPCTVYNFEHWKGRTHPWHRRMLFTRNQILHPVVPTPRGTEFLRWSQSTWSVREHDLGGLVL